MLAPLFAVAVCALAPQETLESATLNVRITATVLDDAFQPLPGVAAFVVESIDDGLDAALAESLDVSDPDGGIALDVEVPQNAARWVVFGGRGLAMQVHRVRTRRSGTVDLGPFAMARGFTLAGRVRNAAGEPIPGARIVATDLLDDVPHLNGHRGGQSVTFRTATRSDGSGLFRLPGMVTSLGRVEVSAVGFLAERFEPVSMETPIDAVLHPAPTVSGVLRDSDGQPLAMARVLCDRAHVATSAVDGTFSFHLPRRDARAFRATASVDGVYLSCGRTFAAEDWGTGMEFELAPRSQGPQQQLAVRAVDRDGDPIDAFTAVVSWNPEDQLDYRPDALLLGRRYAREADWVASAENGVAHPAGGAPRTREDVALVYALAPGYGTGRVQLDRHRTDQPVKVELPPEAIVRGRVVDEQSGEPIPGVRVIPTQRLTDSERGSHASGYRDIADLARTPLAAETDADGRYELRGLAPGKTDIFLLHPERLFLDPLTLELEQGERTGVDFHLRPSVALNGRVVDAPAGTRVRLHWHRPNMWSSAWAQDHSGAQAVADDGAFSFADLQPKPWEVQVLASAPPRGGRCLKTLPGVWTPPQPDDPEPNEEPRPMTVLAPRLVQGTVGGDVPWHRLAVTVFWQRRPNHSSSRVTLDNPIALLGPDRSFRMFAPRCSVHVLVFDAWTGVPLHWQELSEDSGDAKALELPCAAVPLDVTVHGGATGRTPHTCEIELELPDDDGPRGIGGLRAARGPFGSDPNRASARVRTDQPTTLWLRNREGTLRVKQDGSPTVELEILGEPKIEVALPQRGS